jgi:predicted amidohydrolase
MRELKIALLQMAASADDQATNQARGEAFCRRAHAMDADIALFRETGGNAFRKPHRYSALTSLEVEPPFVRVDGGGEMYDRARR